MGKRSRRKFSGAHKKELWKRWRQGESISEIARALERKPGTIHCLVSASGGIEPRPRRRSPRTLSLSEREEISRGIAAGDSMRAIAARIQRSPSTVSREVGRNGGVHRYRAIDSDREAWNRARRPKGCRLASNPRLRKVVAEKLRLNWSPEQISGWLRRNYSSDKDMQISYETIYRSLYVQARGVLEKNLVRHLRSKRMMRRPKAYSTQGQVRGQIVGAVSIHERPSEIEGREEAGHWEGDLITGSKNTHIATLVERHSRFTALVQVDGKDPKTVVGALVRRLRWLPAGILRTLTWDRGTEMARHREFSAATKMPVYFCDPKSPWQRGTNENTNRLLRQYLPKATDLSTYSQDELDRIACQLNQRPRKVLGFESPEVVFNRAVALTC